MTGSEVILGILGTCLLVLILGTTTGFVLFGATSMVERASYMLLVFSFLSSVALTLHPR
jgi:hypothetical protein